MEVSKVARQVVRGIVVIGTVFALLLAGGAPSDHTNKPTRPPVTAE